MLVHARPLPIGIAFVPVLVMFLAAVPDARGDVYDLPRITAIQNRAHMIEQGLALSGGYLPADPFDKGYVGSVAYTYYFTDFIGWEVINYSHVWNQETQTKKDFRDLNIVAINEGLRGVLDFPIRFITSGILYTPLYNKSVLFSRSVVHGETSFYLGGGTVTFNEVGRRAVITPGFQLRFYMSSGTALRVYFREHLYKDEQAGITGIMDVGLGFEFRFPLLPGRRREGGG